MDFVECRICLEMHSPLNADLFIDDDDKESEGDYDSTWETDDEFEDATESASPSDENEAVDTEMEDDGNHVETAEDRVRAALARTAAMFNPPAKPAKMVVLPDEAPQDHHFIRNTTQPLNGSFMGRVAKEQNILFSALPEGKRLLRLHPILFPTDRLKETASQC